MNIDIDKMKIASECKSISRQTVSLRSVDNLSSEQSNVNTENNNNNNLIHKSRKFKIHTKQKWWRRRWNRQNANKMLGCAVSSSSSSSSSSFSSLSMNSKNLSTTLLSPNNIVKILYNNVSTLDLKYRDVIYDTMALEHVQLMLNASMVSKDVNSLYNYEFFEYIGDAIINRYIIEYIRHKYVGIANTSHNIGIMTKLRSVFVGKRNLSKCSIRIGLHKFLNCAFPLDMVRLEQYAQTIHDSPNEIDTQFDEPNFALCRELESLMEDLLESFIGVLWYAMYRYSALPTKEINDIIKVVVWCIIGDGAGVVDPTYERLNSARDRLNIATKELYENRVSITTVPNETNNGFKSTILLDKKSIIAIGHGSRTRDAICNASIIALNTLPGLLDYIPSTSVIKNYTIDITNYITTPQDIDRYHLLCDIMSVHNIKFDDLKIDELITIRSAFTDPLIDADLNFNLGHFHADALIKNLLNTHIMGKYPCLRTSAGIQIMQSVNEKFRTHRSLLCSTYNLEKLANISIETRSQRIPMEIALMSIFDAVIVTMHTIVEYRYPGKGDELILKFINNCCECIGMKIEYEYLMSHQLRLAHMVKSNNLCLNYEIESSKNNNSTFTNFRQGSMVISFKNSKKTDLKIGSIRAIDDKSMKNILAANGVRALVSNGIPEIYPEAYTLKSNCQPW
ncbi:ribonuclease III [Trichoplusia ni ascovirus 2c]|uniref:ribonuclease III n=1 Tax=Trichoplusia ni ascovirus 2c TaxID=328615 RepID=UPI0000E441E0|nr:ribonuclease III [Trichoplusia ni ascovirus 2c]ABF70525.1 ribonuclease III [Trichoplusia ni ascovirus 2c]